MRVLQFAPRVCWPLDTGAKLRNYHLARVLAKHAQITLLAFVDAEQSLADLENLYAQVIAVQRDRAYTVSKILRGAFGDSPLPVMNYTTDSMKQMLERVLHEQDFDVVQVESVHLMAYLPTIRAARNRPLAVCDWHNIESELMLRYSEHEPNVLRRAYARKTARLMSEFEKRAMHEFDAHLVVSERDAERLRLINAEASIFVIENGVDTAYYSDEPVEQAHAAWPVQPARNESAKTNRIVFVGSMDYHANVDGVAGFAREVWPRLRDRQPELVFTIVGRDPLPQVRELERISGVEVTGTVDDVRPFYREALASVVPLNVGGGSRLKILEAMAAGVPVVSTSLGAEGLKLRHGENILIADSSEQLVESISSVVENADLRKRLSEAGRALVVNRYDWSTLGALLFRIYEELSSTKAEIPPA